MRNLIYFIYSFQNSNYPTGYLPTTANTCTFTVNKVNDNICQLRCRISFLKMYLIVILADLTLRLFLGWPPQLLERAATAWPLLGWVDTTLQPFVGPTLDTTVRLIFLLFSYCFLFYLFLRIRPSLHLWDQHWITKFPFHPTPTFDVKLCYLFIGPESDHCLLLSLTHWLTN